MISIRGWLRTSQFTQKKGREKTTPRPNKNPKTKLSAIGFAFICVIIIFLVAAAIAIFVLREFFPIVFLYFLLFGGHRTVLVSFVILGSIRELICSPMLLDIGRLISLTFGAHTPDRCMAIFDLLNLLILIELFVCVDVIEKLTTNPKVNRTRDRYFRIYLYFVFDDFVIELFVGVFDIYIVFCLYICRFIRSGGFELKRIENK